MENKEQLGNVYARLLKARQIVLENSIKKDAKNDFAKFKYMTLEEIIPVTEYASQEVGILVMTNFTNDEVQTIVMNVDDTEDYIMFTSPFNTNLGTGQIKGAQAYGALHTYFRRYMLMLVFEIVEHDALDSQDTKYQNETQNNATQNNGRVEKQMPTPTNQVASKTIISDETKLKNMREEVKSVASQLADAKGVKPAEIFRSYGVTANENVEQLNEIIFGMLDEMSSIANGGNNVN